MNAGGYGKIRAMPRPHPDPLPTPFRPPPRPPSGRPSASSNGPRRMRRCNAKCRPSNTRSSGSGASALARRARSARLPRTRRRCTRTKFPSPTRHPRPPTSGWPATAAYATHRFRPGQERRRAVLRRSPRTGRAITLASPELGGLPPEQYEVIGEKVSYRLAQRPGGYVILKCVRPLIKRRDTQTRHCPAGVIDGCRADVSFLVGLLLDKFAWHLPLYRQHQRLLDAGITVSRAWLTSWPRRPLRCSSRSTRPGWPRSARAASRPWTRRRSRPAAPARAR